MNRFLERITETPLVFDGAMGTMLYQRGLFLNACYDEACLSRPDLVREIHEAYVKAGADAIETNTFGANRVKLAAHGLIDKVDEINRRAAELAREAAGDDVFVAGAVGPCLRVGQIYKEDARVDIGEAFREQIEALAAGGVDLVQLETFFNLDELAVAAEVARAAGLPVVASVTVGMDGASPLGQGVEDVVAELDGDGNIDVVGLNCGVGPSAAYDAVERGLPMTDKPFVVAPNAGMPREVDGRMLYLTSPEYFTSYAKKFIELGVRGVGGCCGTTPEHIRMAARAVKSLSGVKRHVQIRVYHATSEAEAVELLPLNRKSRLGAKLATGEKVTSVEILPPKSSDMSKMLARARTCYEHGVDCMNIPDGPRASARVSPMIASIAIQNEVGIEPILHYCCRDRNLIGMQSDLMGGFAAGLRNFLIITGDPPKLGDYPDATGVFDVDSIGLTQVARNLNHGRDIGGGAITPPTAICIGVGANPVAVEMKREIDRYFQKVDAGAEFAITQPIFDVAALLRFLDAVERHKTTIPVVAGVWPLVSLKNAEFMNNEVPGVEVPDEVIERMSRCRTREEGVATGVDIARETIQRIADRVAGFQVSAPFGKVEVALDVLAAAPA